MRVCKFHLCAENTFIMSSEMLKEQPDFFKLKRRFVRNETARKNNSGASAESNEPNSIEKTSVTSLIKILTWCNIYSLPSLNILCVNRQFIRNISSSRSFLPLSRSRPILLHIYSCQNYITFNNIILFFHAKLITVPN